MRFDIADASLAEEGALRIEWAARRMPVLAVVRERFVGLVGREQQLWWRLLDGPHRQAPRGRRRELTPAAAARASSGSTPRAGRPRSQSFDREAVCDVRLGR